MTAKRAMTCLGILLAAAALGAGSSVVVSRIKDAAPELDRPDLLIATGVCVLVWVAGAGRDESLPEA